MGVQKIKSRRNQRRKQEKIIAAVLVGVVLILVILAGIGMKNSSKMEAERRSQLEGLWIYDSITSYEFDSDGSGVMYVNEQEYNFSYVLQKRTLQVDFENEALYDCEYEISIQEDVLTLKGMEGTTGGTYELVRKTL